MSEHCILLFEVLDEPPLLSGYAMVEGGEEAERYLRLGWAFLRPIGLLGHINIGSAGLLQRLNQHSRETNPLMQAAETAAKCDEVLRLQLYEYQ